MTDAPLNIDDPTSLRWLNVAQLFARMSHAAERDGLFAMSARARDAAVLWMNRHLVKTTSDTRITMAEVMLRTAENMALRAVCSRGIQVGCVISSWDYDRIVAIGYNGPPRGRPHECSAVPGACGCVHAELNALIKAPYTAGAEPLRMFLTLSPCAACTALILNSDVRDVTYRIAYRDVSHLHLLTHAGISVNNPL